MALSNQDRVLESSTTTGTGTYTLAGALTGFRSFSAVGDGNTVTYATWEVDANGNPSGGWETGLGTYTASGTTLARTTIYQSSNANAAVSWAAGTRYISCTPQSAHVAATVDVLANSLSSGNTGTVLIGPIPGFTDFGGIWFGESSPSSTNYSFLGKQGVGTLFNNANEMAFRISNVDLMHVKNYVIETGFASTGAADATTTFFVHAGAAGGTYKGIVVKSQDAGQSANLQEWQNSSGAVLSFVGPTGWIVNKPGEAALESAFTKTNATLGNTNLSVTLIAGRSYRIDGYLIVSNTVPGEGAKFDFDGGTATATTFDVCLNAVGGTVVAGTIAATAIATDLNYTSVTGTTRIFVHGYIEINAGGTFILRASEDSTLTGTMTLGAGSWLAFYDTVDL